MPETIVKVRYQRYSPRKVAQVLNLIRKKEVEQAFNILRFVKKRPKEMIEKALKSAVANLNRLSNPKGLYIKECYVTQGPSLKRFRVAGFGRVVMYKRKTCHLTMRVGD